MFLELSSDINEELFYPEFFLGGRGEVISCGFLFICINGTFLCGEVGSF